MSIDLKYVLIFIKCKDEILLINREFPTWMGRWNGTGGHIEKNETPLVAANRELLEETGIRCDNLKCLSEIGWIINDDLDTLGGMYVFLGEIDEKNKITTPIKTNEGILDWKKVSWILNEENTGIPDNIRTFLPDMLNNQYSKYLCCYKDKFDVLGKIVKHDLLF